MRKSSKKRAIKDQKANKAYQSRHRQILALVIAAAAAISENVEESLLKASAEAAKASSLAADFAAEEVKLSNQARDIKEQFNKGMTESLTS
jgi:hypothetical protein